MVYVEQLRQYGQSPRQIEELYQQARQQGQVAEFTQSVQLLHAEDTDQLLIQAWVYRLAGNTEDQRTDSNPNWPVAIGVSIVSGLLFWFLADEERLILSNEFPLFFLAAAPIAAFFVMVFLWLTQPMREPIQRTRLLGLGLLLAGGVAYVAWVGPQMAAEGNRNSYLFLAAPHLILLSWIAIGMWLLWTRRAVSEQFAFLLKSFEVIVVGGLFALAGLLFTGITFGLLATLTIEVEDWVGRLLFAGGLGLIPVLAVALVYDPKRAPQEQHFHGGISQLITTLMRLMLPLVLALLVIYLALIPFNFREPFQNRDVLIIYNLLLFAVIGLLISATPLATQALPPTQARWLRRGLIALAGLAVLVSLYALTAILYRTWTDGFTPNRLTIIGWNVINIGLLSLLLLRQARSTSQTWLPASYLTFAQGAKVYLVWAVIVLVVIPWLFMWTSEPILPWGR